MDRVTSQFSIKNAEIILASARRALLIAAQTGDVDDLSISRRDLVCLHAEALDSGHTTLAEAVSSARDALDEISPECAVEGTMKALDLLALIEANVWRLGKSELIDNVADFVDNSFDELARHNEHIEVTELCETFDIDDETLEIFRSEADELLANIFDELEKLASSPADTTALWNIRRSSHTFKGAAGIVGLSEASATAHRMEDLLDKMVELRVEASKDILEFLDASAMHLNALVTAKNLDNDPNLDKYYERAIRSLDPNTNGNGVGSHTAATIARPDNFRPASAPIVRIALDRLDDILSVSQRLIANQKLFAERLAAVGLPSDGNQEALSNLTGLLDVKQTLTNELHTKLQQIRMVRFGTLETRLSRAVQVTSIDEGKKATIELENGDVEVDTQIIDALIEPLLHLIKNAVVHGIERPETRRLLGKPETGKVIVRIDADDEAIIAVIADDGSGLSPAKLKDKAVANGTISTDAAERMNDRDAFRLIFDRGLTTAEKIDLNAGRGVGMSIVKESVENRGGTVHVESEPQKGTTFTLFIPLNRPEHSDAEPEMEQAVKASNAHPLVLIVDDSPSIRRQTQKIVTAAGLRTITANSGAEALELLLNGTIEPDLILSDVEMPHVDGWEMLEYIKTDENFGHIPVVMVTSLDSEADQTRAAELGASGYVIKPFTEKDLTYALECLGITATA